MIQIPVFNPDGSDAGSVEVDEARLGGAVRPALLKQAYVRVHANKRSINQVTKSRSMVRGSNKKLYKQKGTGNARRGDKKANILRGGGHAKPKQAHSWDQRMPVKQRRLANRNALLAKAVDGEIKLVAGYELEQPSTKAFQGLLDALGMNRTVLYATSDVNSVIARSSRNVADASLTHIDRLNVFDVLNHRFLLASQADFEAYLERYVNHAPSSSDGSNEHSAADHSAAEPTTAGAL